VQVRNNSDDAGGLADRKTGERDGLLFPIRLCALRDSRRYVANHFIGQLTAAGEPAPEDLYKAFVPFTSAVLGSGGVLVDQKRTNLAPLVLGRGVYQRGEVLSRRLQYRGPGYDAGLLCRFRLGRALSPLPSRLRAGLAAASLARRPAWSFALAQFEFDETVTAVAVGVVDRFDAGTVAFKIDILHGNSRFRHLCLSFRACHMEAMPVQSIAGAIFH